MPTNANTFNSRVTSEALEAKFRSVFPAQGGAELVQDLYASGVIQPVIDFSSVAEGSALRSDLQRAWDHSTGAAVFGSAIGSTTIINNPGFWKIDVIFAGTVTLSGGTPLTADIDIYDGSTAKPVWGLRSTTGAAGTETAVENEEFVVFLRAGDSLRGTISGLAGFCSVNVVYRQIADVYGNLVNPLGYTSS